MSRFRDGQLGTYTPSPVLKISTTVAPSLGKTGRPFQSRSKSRARPSSEVRLTGPQAKGRVLRRSS